MPVARILPCSDSWAPRHRFFSKELGPDGRMDRRSELTRFTAPARHEAWTGEKSAFRNEPYGTDLVAAAGADRAWFSQQLFAFAFLRSLTNRA